MKGRGRCGGGQRCRFQRQFSLTKPKRGEKKRVKRETGRKTCTPKVGGGGGHIWYRALLECDWMLCCRGLFANLYLHKTSQRLKMLAEGLVSWEALAWVGETVGKRCALPVRSLFQSPVGLSSLKRKGTPLTDSWLGGRWLEGDETTLNEKRREKRGWWREVRQSRRGGACEEHRQEEGSKWQQWDSDISFIACVLLCLNGVNLVVGLILLWTDVLELFPGWLLKMWLQDWKLYLNEQVRPSFVLLSTCPT